VLHLVEHHAVRKRDDEQMHLAIARDDVARRCDEEARVAAFVLTGTLLEDGPA